MRALVSACHDLGIRIIIDLPLNHSSTEHPWFKAAAESLREGRPGDLYVDYYVFSREQGSKFVPLSGTDWYYEEQFSGGSMPDLNLDSKALREEIRGILGFWLNGIGVDGFRLDAVTSFYAGDDDKNTAFLRFLNDAAKALKPGCFIVGECWKGLDTIARYYDSGIDSFFLFPASQAEGYVAASMRARKPAETYVKYLNRVREAIPQGILTPFLSNHDTGRTVGLVQGRQAPERVKFAHSLIALMGGYTFTYYGEEIGMAGSGADPNKRLGMLWNEKTVTDLPPGVTAVEYPFPSVDIQAADPDSLLSYIKKLNHQKLVMPAIALGDTAIDSVTADTLVLIRTFEDERLYIAINFSAKEAREILLEGQFDLSDTLDTGAITSDAAVRGQDTLITLQPLGIAYLRK
jgi:glycosidase